MKSPFKDKPNIRRYSVLPARAMQDERLNGACMKILACLGMYTNSYGVCWPSQLTIARHLGYGRVHVCRTMATLIKLGYVRKLETRPYPRHIKRRSGKKVNRYQVLWEGNDPIPNNEQFWAPARIIAEAGDDEVAEQTNHMQTGVQGDANKDYQTLAHTFRKAVEKACGAHRLPDPSYKSAKVLWDQGVRAEQVRDATAAFVREALAKGRTPPLTLDQVAKWSGLYKK
jgi:hypothetical protein